MVRKGGIFGLGSADGFGAVSNPALDFSKAVGASNNPLALGVQKALHTQGYTSLPIDGDWADCSQAALIDHVKTSGVVSRVPSPSSDPAGALSVLTKAVQGAFNWKGAGVDPAQVKPWIKDGSACATWAKDPKTGKPYDPNTAKKLNGSSPYASCIPAVLLACELGNTTAADQYCAGLDPNSISDCCGCVKKELPTVPAEQAPPQELKPPINLGNERFNPSLFVGFPATTSTSIPNPPVTLVKVKTGVSKPVVQQAATNAIAPVAAAKGMNKWLILLIAMLLAGGAYAAYEYYEDDSAPSDLGDDDFAMPNKRRRHRRSKGRRR